MSKHSAKKRILIADDHPMVREWFAQMINREPDLHVCGEAADAPQTLQAIERLDPDLALIDLAMDGACGTDLIRTVASRHPTVPVLVVSMHEESVYAERALHAGARGYISKREVGEKIKQAIRRVLDGGIYVSEITGAQILEELVHGPSPENGPLSQLSDREWEVFRLLGSGDGPSQIAEQLRVSVKSIEMYMARIKEKLRLKDARELHHQAVQYRLAERSASIAVSPPSAPQPSPGP